MPHRDNSSSSEASRSTSSSAGKTPKPSAATPQPLVTLDPAGVATPLSYSVPEPMAYSGRNYITLELPPEAYLTRAVDPEQVLALTPAAHLAEPPGQAKTAASPIRVTHGVPLLRVQRRTDDAVATLLPDGNRPPVDLPDPPDVTVLFDNPAPGSTAQGTSNGVTVQASGRWSGDGFAGSPGITLSVDGQTPVAAKVTD